MLIASKMAYFHKIIGTKIIQKISKFVSKMAFSQGKLIIEIILLPRQKIGGRGVTKGTCMYKDLTIHNTNLVIISVAQYPNISYSPNIYNFDLSMRTISIAIK